MNIYQAIWDADMKGNGIRPISTNENKDKSQGYVVVDTENCHPEHRILQEVYIPEEKRSSYLLVEKLFNNYTLNQKYKETNTLNEFVEVEEFLTMAIQSFPSRTAKEFIEEKSNKKFSELQWYTYLYDLWFRQFDSATGKDLSGFEHVFIGEQQRKRLVGHHFWYKYWLEDNADINEHHKDQIVRNCSVHSEQICNTLDVITIGYHLEAFDYPKKRFVKLVKKNSGFFVGVSAEGILALGAVRATSEGYEDAVINGVRYKLELSRSRDGRSIRTFYPIYVPS